jgi:hypothetical protein
LLRQPTVHYQDSGCGSQAKKNANARVLLALLGTDIATPSMGAVGASVAGSSFGAALEVIVQAASEQRGNATADTRDIIATQTN